MVQGLRLRASTEAGMSSIPGQGTKIPHAVQSRPLKSYLVAQTVKRLSAMQETWVRSLGWEDPLEKEMSAHSSILAWTIPWTMEPGRLLSMGSQRVGHD